MARISGIDLPRDKRIEIALTHIYGIGRKTASNICAATGVNPDIRVRDLSEDDTAKLRDYIDKNCHVEGDLRRGLLPRRPSPQGPSGKRPAHEDQRQNPQRSQKDHGEQEKVRRD